MGEKIGSNGQSNIGKYERTVPAGERFPAVGSIRTLQAIVNHMSEGLAPHEGPDEVFAHLQVERQETHEALIEGNRKHIASEIADEIILLTRLACFYGIDVEEAVSRKIARNAAKYPNLVAQNMREAGMEADEVRRALKQGWNRADDKHFEIS